MKIAIISDIHGNIQALEAVLDDIKKESCKKIYCLGDLAMAGPNPNQAVKKLKSMSEKEQISILLGNTDLMLTSDPEIIYKKLKEKNEIMANAYLDDIKVIDNMNKEFLRNLPKKIEISLGSLKILMVHGSPRKIDENIYPDLPISEVEEITKDTNANLIFCGHTHLPCGYQTNTNKTVVNVGSVGRPFNLEPKSCYVILEYNDQLDNFTILHKYISYDYKKASEILSKRRFKGADKLAKMLISATSRYPQ